MKDHANKPRVEQLDQKFLSQVHTETSLGASPVTSQLRWARLDVTGLAPLLVERRWWKNPLSRVGHTHTLKSEKVIRVETPETAVDTHNAPNRRC